MKRLRPALIALGLLVSPARAEDAKPFTLTIVPSSSNESGRTINKADKKQGQFFVVLTNISKEPQPVFETWNSWGYQNLSFELTLADGKKAAFTVKDQDFTRNFPSTFTIPPGGCQVYPIHIDEAWGMKPKLKLDPEAKVKLKAIYEVKSDPDATKEHVWTGHAESETSEFILWHW